MDITKTLSPKILVSIIGLIIILWACNRPNDANPVQQISNYKSKFNRQILVINEGNYGWSDGEISLYNPQTRDLIPNLFYSNNLFALGNVIQSVGFQDSILWVVANNSQKIELISLHNFKSKYSITGFVSPRYIVFANNKKAYISDLYADKIWIVSTQTKQIIGNIRVQGWSEKMCVMGSKVYVCCKKTIFDMRAGGNQIYEIDSNTDQITDSLAIGERQSDILTDKNNHIWLNTVISNKAALICVYNNPLRVMKTIYLSESTSGASNLCFNKTRDSLYFVQKNVYRMPIVLSSNEPQIELFFRRGIHQIYGLGLDTLRNDIYVCDAKNFVQAGAVLRIAASGIVTDTFAAGIIPNGIVLVP